MIGSSFVLLFLSVFYGREMPFLSADLSSGHWLTWTDSLTHLVFGYPLSGTELWLFLPTLGHRVVSWHWSSELVPLGVLSLFFSLLFLTLRKTLFYFWSYYPIFVFPFYILVLCVQIRGSSSNHKLPACYWLKCFYA